MGRYGLWRVSEELVLQHPLQVCFLHFKLFGDDVERAGDVVTLNTTGDFGLAGGDELYAYARFRKRREQFARYAELVRHALILYGQFGYVLQRMDIHAHIARTQGL